MRDHHTHTEHDAGRFERFGFDDIIDGPDPIEAAETAATTPRCRECGDCLPHHFRCCSQHQARYLQ